MKEFIFILACVFCIFQCEDQTITETRILQFHEIEAPEEVSVSSESFEIILKNTCYDGGCGIDYLHCYESFSWVTDRKNNYLELTPQASHSYQPGDAVCGALGHLGTETYQVQGPFEIGSFHIIVHQRNYFQTRHYPAFHYPTFQKTTLEKVVKIVE